MPPPPQIKAIEIYIIITTPYAKIPEWPGKNPMGTELIGSFQLNNKNTVWAVSKIGKGKGHFFKGKSKSDLKEFNNIRALVFGDNPDGSRVIYDIAVSSGTS